MIATDLLIDAIRDHIEAVAPATLAMCSFAIRDQAISRSFPQVRISERGIEEDEILLGVYRCDVEVTLRTIPDDTSDSDHYTMVEELWNIVADEDIENSLSSVDRLKVHDARCAGPISSPDDDYRSTSLELNCVFHRV